MFVKNLLLLAMMLIYMYVIYKVSSYYKYEIDGSISSIIKNEECSQVVFVNMILMGIVTLFYEVLRYDICSFISICFLLIGIYGVIIYDHSNTIHFVYCFIVFTSILVFMYNHCYKKSNKLILYLSLYLQQILCAAVFLQTNIMNCEIYLLANFAVFYIYLHFVN
jgi:hypothetical protein